MSFLRRVDLVVIEWAGTGILIPVVVGVAVITRCSTSSPQISGRVFFKLCKCIRFSRSFACFSFQNSSSLHTRINDSTFECLGEEVDGTGRKVFKNYDDRMEKETFVNSDCDPELLFNIPFTGNVKIFSIIIIGGEDDEQPTKVKIFKNTPGLTFDDAQGKKADQEIDLR